MPRKKRTPHDDRVHDEGKLRSGRGSARASSTAEGSAPQARARRPKASGGDAGGDFRALQVGLMSGASAEAPPRPSLDRWAHDWLPILFLLAPPWSQWEVLASLRPDIRKWSHEGEKAVKKALRLGPGRKPISAERKEIAFHAEQCRAAIIFDITEGLLEGGPLSQFLEISVGESALARSDMEAILAEAKRVRVDESRTLAEKRRAAERFVLWVHRYLVDRNGSIHGFLALVFPLKTVKPAASWKRRQRARQRGEA